MSCGTGRKDLGMPKDEIEAAVKRVGPRVEDVAKEVSLLYA
jgi:hypothetical protein